MQNKKDLHRSLTGCCPCSRARPPQRCTAASRCTGMTPCYAGSGNALEEILRAQKIDTVILSGLGTSGVVLDTVYHLYDLDYVIANNTIETPIVANNPIQAAILGSEGIVGGLGSKDIAIEEALEGLKNSGLRSTDVAGRWYQIRKEN
jgi:hypothetical protein